MPRPSWTVSAPKASSRPSAPFPGAVRPSTTSRSASFAGRSCFATRETCAPSPFREKLTPKFRYRKRTVWTAVLDRSFRWAWAVGGDRRETRSHTTGMAAQKKRTLALLEAPSQRLAGV
eukprot:scaffold659_cov318-Pavlova_lutheri.AAC.13